MKDFGDSVSLLTKTPLNFSGIGLDNDGCAVVVAGPGSSFSVPGLIVSEIVQALARSTPTIRIEVDVNTHLITGLHRAPSLSAAHETREIRSFGSYRAPNNKRQRGRFFRGIIGRDVAVVVAYVWPGIDNSWITQITAAGRSAGAITVIVCASLPQPGHAKASNMSPGIFAGADVVLVGDELEAIEVRRLLGRWGPKVESHAALSLNGRGGHRSPFEITAFLPRDGVESLKTVLSAFDAIPDAWIRDYKLHVVMRGTHSGIAALISERHHHRHVELVGDQMSSNELEKMVCSSSAVSVATPEGDSRAFSAAMDSGIGIVVMGDARWAKVGRGYVGGLTADATSPASLHVALSHALRLGGLRFPHPSSWDGLARRLSPIALELAARPFKLNER